MGTKNKLKTALDTLRSLFKNGFPVSDELMKDAVVLFSNPKVLSSPSRTPLPVYQYGTSGVVSGHYVIASISSGYDDIGVWGAQVEDPEDGVLRDTLPYSIYTQLAVKNKAVVPGKLNKGYHLFKDQPTIVEGYDGKHYRVQTSPSGTTPQEKLLAEYNAIKEDEMRYIAKANLLELSSEDFQKDEIRYGR